MFSDKYSFPRVRIVHFVVLVQEISTSCFFKRKSIAVLDMIILLVRKKIESMWNCIVGSVSAQLPLAHESCLSTSLSKQVNNRLFANVNVKHFTFICYFF